MGAGRCLKCGGGPEITERLGDVNAKTACKLVQTETKDYEFTHSAVHFLILLQTIHFQRLRNRKREHQAHCAVLQGKAPSSTSSKHAK